MVINFVVLSRRSLKLRKSAGVEEGTVGSKKRCAQNERRRGRKVIYCPLYRARAEFKVGFTHATPELCRQGLNVLIKTFRET